MIGELDPIVTETEPLANGRHRVYFMRRIDVYTDIDAPPATVLDDPAWLRIDPADQRQ